MSPLNWDKARKQKQMADQGTQRAWDATTQGKKRRKRKKAAPAAFVPKPKKAFAWVKPVSRIIVSGRGVARVIPIEQ